MSFLSKLLGPLGRVVDGWFHHHHAPSDNAPAIPITGALTSAEIGALDSTQMAALAAPDFAALSTMTLQGLRAAQPASLSTADIAALGTVQFEALVTTHARSTRALAAVRHRASTSIWRRPGMRERSAGTHQRTGCWRSI